MTASAATATQPWPLAEAPAFALMRDVTRGRLGAYLRAALERDVITTWFAHGVDREGGGFVTDFDRRWRPAGPQRRMLEFQARQARSAARLALAFPSESRWPELALHGLRFLRDTLWDSEHGGWYWLLAADGTPLAGATKHSHGTAYAIGACVEVYRATGDPAALELAEEGFAWLERALHDPEHGGYHGWARREGTPILSVAETPDGRTRSDPLGHGVGHKDVNVTSDLLEMLADCHDHLPGAAVRVRVRELRDCVLRMLTPDGGLHYAAHADWTPVPGPERYGYHLLTAFRLVRVAALLGDSVETALDQARLLAGHTIERGARAGGGFAYAGPASAPDVLEGTRLVVRRRAWWVQLEALKVLLLLAVQDHPTRRHFAARLREHLVFIERHCRDHRYGGWYEYATADLSRRARLTIALGRGSRFKGGVWKDSSHETDVYLACLRMARGLPPEAPLEG
jgi:mannobiose 2-epimerase